METGAIQLETAIAAAEEANAAIARGPPAVKRSHRQTLSTTPWVRGSRQGAT